MWNPLAEVVRPTLMGVMSAALTAEAARVATPNASSAAGASHLFASYLRKHDAHYMFLEGQPQDLHHFDTPCFLLHRKPMSDRTL